MHANENTMVVWKSERQVEMKNRSTCPEVYFSKTDGSMAIYNVKNI